ncbi:MAG: hypothetical protein Q7S33_02535 [Nanoarchaeota archaeon]|nr:hypothetical protein [Nanoarchaeota archaeon]
MDKKEHYSSEKEYTSSKKNYSGAGFVLSLTSALNQHEFSHDRQLIANMFDDYSNVFKKPRRVRDDELLPEDMIRWDKP